MTTTALSQAMAPVFEHGYFASLSQGDTAALLDHWQRMCRTGIQSRFMRAMSAEALAAHAASVFAGGGHVIGWFQAGVLRGVAELHPEPDGSGEAAFTVEPGFRKRGIGLGLMRRVLRRARNLGLKRVRIETTRDNRAMVRLALSVGAELTSDGREVLAVVPLSPATGASLAADVADGAAGTSAAIGLAGAVFWLDLAGAWAQFPVPAGRPCT
ncbi:hypothetical protein LNKW23_03370 [Paralimibaculum aggregatum]|uniref:N-acetyltransferase domain-containing protein n=1 Tax=Paralimibaculum aggregatum TaxID=3036245 RepID=A0ABQ6LG01_9RHOB|nr:GNAT family N-acetyltransferase [Limibaculum sp. NKW23]GMG81125.1 hypothetical protein LNKW23_03370 [Limibaculum sp. NKW23]